ncbi:integral membrane protein-like protein [Ampelomyces quisqualis]|uniref:Integral membrane protein-like protein n=1 Tax=Ampelomyces quisqualis TaxID=50730 RepID=A0A6A5Q845_AMPQU|nr:integral membrane protein-like protein [Ampelomyces quisqualis]
MRFTALIQVLCCTIALILSFLCLFAGHEKSFMEDYHLITLNTSLVGQTILPTSSSPPSTNPLTNLLNLIPDPITDAINEQIGNVAARLGIEDFYSAHLLTHCSGQYTPSEVPTSTISASQISKSVTSCSAPQALYTFDPTALVEAALKQNTGLDVSLQDIRWPENIQSNIDALNTAMRALFVLYVLAILFIFLALGTAVWSKMYAARWAVWTNICVVELAGLAVALASVLVTAVMVKTTGIVNRLGNDVGIEAYAGRKFLGLTWASTALMVVVSVVLGVEWYVARRAKSKSVGVATQGEVRGEKRRKFWL